MNEKPQKRMKKRTKGISIQQDLTKDKAAEQNIILCF